MATDFTPVTELPGSRVSREQLARLYLRYYTAGVYSEGKRVLEVACGPGLGLGYLARRAKTIVGGDYSENLLRIAQSHYQGRIPLVCLDAHYLPFREQSFDLVIIFEAIYYLRSPEKAIAEAYRVLTDGGILLISMWNGDWADLIPSPLSIRYLGVTELRDLLIHQGFTDLQFFGAFPAIGGSIKQRAISLIRRMAIRLDIVPRSLKGRAWLKRVFYGRLIRLGPEVEDDMAELHPLVPIDGNVRNTQYKVLYAVASRR